MAEEILDASDFAPDILEFLTLLHRHQVHYLIVGGEAVIYYGYARLTGDIDFFYDCDDQNARQLFAVLLEFWGGNVPGVARAEELREPGAIVQFGVPPHRIDLINDIDGVRFAAAWPNRKTVHVVTQPVPTPIYYVSLDDLIKNKEASNRPKDQDDLPYLRQQRARN